MTGTKKAEYCSRHAPDGMINVHSRKCRTEGCAQIPSFGVDGTRMVKYCAQHALGTMVDINHRKCRPGGCGKFPSFGVAGSKTMEYCAKHAPVEMVDVENMKGRTEDGGKQPSFEVEGTKTMENCAPLAPNDMIDACSRNSTTGGCGKQPSFGVANTRTSEYCAENTRIKCGVKGYREREVDPYHCGKEIIGNVISPPSGGSRGSRKRARHPEVTFSASKRAVADSTAGAVTMPDIAGQKSPVKRDSSLKTEVQLFY